MANFAVSKLFRPRLDRTELLMFTRGKTTSGAKRLVGQNDQGRNDQGGNDQGGVTTRGGEGLGA